MKGGAASVAPHRVRAGHGKRSPQEEGPMHTPGKRCRRLDKVKRTEGDQGRSPARGDCNRSGHPGRRRRFDQRQFECPGARVCAHGRTRLVDPTRTMACISLPLSLPFRHIPPHRSVIHSEPNSVRRTSRSRSLHSKNAPTASQHAHRKHQNAHRFSEPPETSGSGLFRTAIGAVRRRSQPTSVPRVFRVRDSSLTAIRPLHAATSMHLDVRTDPGAIPLDSATANDPLAQGAGGGEGVPEDTFFL